MTRPGDHRLGSGSSPLVLRQKRGKKCSQSFLGRATATCQHWIKLRRTLRSRYRPPASADDRQRQRPSPRQPPPSSVMESIGEGSNAKARAVGALMAVKRRSGKTFGEIAAETGLTNVYVAQLLRRQAQLKPGSAPSLRAALPELTDEMVEEMMRPPMRSYDPTLIQEPAVYRLHEAVMHFGESIKEIINEDFGDGIMSAIDFYCSVDKVKGVDGKDRVVVTFDGKYLPHSEQLSEHMVSKPRQ